MADYNAVLENTGSPATETQVEQNYEDLVWITKTIGQLYPRTTA